MPVNEGIDPYNLYSREFLWPPFSRSRVVVMVLLPAAFCAVYGGRIRAVLLRDISIRFAGVQLGHHRRLSHTTTRFVRLDMKRGPYFGVVYPVSHPTCRIKDSNPNDMSLNSSARTHGCSISFVLEIILIN